MRKWLFLFVIIAILREGLTIYVGNATNTNQQCGEITNPCDLTYAIQQATPGEILELLPGAYILNETLQISVENLTLTSTEGENSVFLSLNNLSQGFEIRAGVQLIGLNFIEFFNQNIQSSTFITTQTDSLVTIKNCYFSFHFSALSTNSSLLIQNCTFNNIFPLNNNSIIQIGGDQFSATITESSFVANTLYNNFTTIEVDVGSLTLQNCDFTLSSTAINILSSNSTVEVDGCAFTDNYYYDIKMIGKSLTIKNSQFNGSIIYNPYSSIYQTSGYLHVDRCSFIHQNNLNNTIYHSGDTLIVENTSFKETTSTEVLTIQSTDMASIASCLFDEMKMSEVFTVYTGVIITDSSIHNSIFNNILVFQGNSSTIVRVQFSDNVTYSGDVFIVKNKELIIQDVPLENSSITANKLTIDDSRLGSFNFNLQKDSSITGGTLSNVTISSHFNIKLTLEECSLNDNSLINIDKGKVSISSSKIYNCYSSNVISCDKLTIDELHFFNNINSSISYNYSTIKNSTFDSNTLSQNYLLGSGSLEISNCTFDQNTLILQPSNNHSQSMIIAGGKTTIIDCQFTNNYAYSNDTTPNSLPIIQSLENSTIYINDSNFYNNTANGLLYGAIFLPRGTTFNVSNSIFSVNYADYGGILNNYSFCQLKLIL